jgi:hypothetical protein
VNAVPASLQLSAYHTRRERVGLLIRSSDITSTLSYAPGAPIGTQRTIAAADANGQYPQFNDTALVPLQTEAEAEADITYDLNVFFETRAGGINRGGEDVLTAELR